MDTFVNSDGKTRHHLYGVAEEPTLYFCGGEKISPVECPNPDSYYVRYQDNINGARSRATSLTMEFDTTTTKIDTNQINIGINVTPTESLPDQANLRLFVVIYEDSAFYLSSFPPFEPKHSLFVVRKILPDTLGLNLTVEFPNSFDTTFTYPVGNWDKAQIGIASFVQNIQTKEVLQAVVKRKF
jgi:hypothetical protein